MNKFINYFVISVSVFLMVLLLGNIFDNKNEELLLGDTYYLGDVDNDGKVGASDYIAVKKHILSTSTLTGEKLKRADVNSDGSINSLDYIRIKKIILNGEQTKVTTSTSTPVPTATPTPTPVTTVYIKDYGAKCDGVTDDTAAITAAFNSVPGKEVNKIDLGSGTCVVSSSILVSCNTTSSNSNIKGRITVTGNATISFSSIFLFGVNPGCDYATFENFTSKSTMNPYKRDVNGDGKVNGYDSVSHIIVANENPTVKLTVSGVTLNGGVTGVSVNGLDGFTVDNSTFADMIYMPENSKGGYGVLCQGCSNMRVTNSRFVAGPYYRHGLYVSRSDSFPKSKNVVIDNCEFDYTGYTITGGQRWSGDSAPLFVRAADNVTVSNCVFKSTPNGGIFQADVDNLTNLVYKDNTLYPAIRNPKSYDYHHGVFFYGTSSNRKVYGLVDNFKVVNPPSGYTSYATALYSEMQIKNNNANGMSISNAGGSTITYLD